MYAHESDHKGHHIQRNPVHEVRETNGPRLPSGCDLGLSPELSNQSESSQLETSEPSWYNGVFGWKLGNLHPCLNEWGCHVKLAVWAQTEIGSRCCAALHMASILMRLTRKLFTFLPVPIVYGKVKPLLWGTNTWTLIQFPWLTLRDFSRKHPHFYHEYYVCNV